MFPTGHRMTFHKYHRMEDIHGYLDYLAQTYPQLVTLTDIGRSLEGRPLRLVKISSGVPNAKAFWIDGGKIIKLIYFQIIDLRLGLSLW